MLSLRTVTPDTLELLKALMSAPEFAYFKKKVVPYTNRIEKRFYYLLIIIK